MVHADPTAIWCIPQGRGVLEKLRVGEVCHSLPFYPLQYLVEEDLVGLEETHFTQSVGDPGEACRGHVNNERAMANALEGSHLSPRQNGSKKI